MFVDVEDHCVMAFNVVDVMFYELRSFVTMIIGTAHSSALRILTGTFLFPLMLLFTGLPVIVSISSQQAQEPHAALTYYCKHSQARSPEYHQEYQRYHLNHVSFRHVNIGHTNSPI